MPRVPNRVDGKVLPSQVACTEPVGKSSEFPSAKSTTALTQEPKAKPGAESKMPLSVVLTLTTAAARGCPRGKVRRMFVPTVPLSAATHFGALKIIR